VVDSPVSVGLIFDSSASMKRRIDGSRAAVDQFLKTTVAEDEFFLVRFSDKAELLTGFTRVPDEISKSLASVRPNGYTAMIDAIWRSIHQMRLAANPRKILLVLSDGGDNRSRYSESELLSLVRESDVRLYAIGLFERPRYLEKLADETGGRVFWVRSLGELPDAVDTLSLQIRTEYVVGYFPRNNHNDGRYRRVSVQVNPPRGVAKVRATWRRGYPTPDD
jgi:Ca-activated chloride channel family protein